MKLLKIVFSSLTTCGLIVFISCTSCDTTGGEGETAPALFAFNDNLAATFNTQVPVSIDVYSKEIQTIDLLINDSVVKTWKKPTSKLTFNVNTAMLGIGAKNLDIEVTYKNGESFTDHRLIRILSDIVPEVWTISILNEYPHNTNNFTQGLEFNNGVLYEGTGQLGQSKVSKVDITTGADVIKMGLDASHFGEGITVLNETLYQITWTTGRCFTYDKSNLQPKSKEFSFTGEGWGLCNNGKSIIMSNGSERITFRDPQTFSIQKTIEVYTNQESVINLNELEFINGFIYANIWMTSKIVVIDPDNGKVIAVMDGAELVKKGRGAIGDVFNGIAYDSQTQKTYMTGKRWEKLFEVSISKPTV